MTIDVFELDQRLLQLAPPGWPEARRIAEAAGDARNAWEALLAAGLVPASWADAIARVHAVVGRLLPLHVAVVAAASSTMIAVEALARDWVTAVEPWGAPALRQIAWGVLPTGKPRMRNIRREYHMCDAMLLASVHANAAGSYVQPALALALESKRRRNAAQRIFVWDVAQHETWAHAVERDATVPPGSFCRRFNVPMAPPPSVIGRSFAALPDPVSPILAIWDAGCAPGIFRDGILRLFLPMPTEPRG